MHNMERDDLKIFTASSLTKGGLCCERDALAVFLDKIWLHHELPSGLRLTNFRIRGSGEIQVGVG
jgi:hypothetical protein